MSNRRVVECKYLARGGFTPLIFYTSAILSVRELQLMHLALPVVQEKLMIICGKTDSSADPMFGRWIHSCLISSILLLSVLRY